MILKAKAVKGGGHVHVGFYSGPDEDHLAFNGKLAFTLEEWVMFRETILLGAKIVSGMIVIAEGYLNTEGVKKQ